MSRSRLLLVCLSLTACGPVTSSPISAATPAPPEIVEPIVYPTTTPMVYPTTTAAQVLEIARVMLPDVGLGPSAMLGQPLPVFLLTSQALRDYRPGTPVASVLTPRSQWMMPVLVQGEGRMLMMVGFENGAWRVVEWNTNAVVARNLALLQQQYADRVNAITLISAAAAGGNDLALVTEGEREALIFLSDGSSFFPELREHPLQTLPPDQVMPKLLAAVCPPGLTC